MGRTIKYFRNRALHCIPKPRFTTLKNQMKINFEKTLLLKIV